MEKWAYHKGDIPPHSRADKRELPTDPKLDKGRDEGKSPPFGENLRTHLPHPDKDKGTHEGIASSK
jgi:hypothetical protein